MSPTRDEEEVSDTPALSIIACFETTHHWESFEVPLGSQPESTHGAGKGKLRSQQMPSYSPSVVLRILDWCGGKVKGDVKKVLPTLKTPCRTCFVGR